MANFNFHNLDEETRKHMLAEIQEDINAGRLYVSERLNETGRQNYQTYFVQSVSTGDPESFEKLLHQPTHFNLTYSRQGKSVKMPSNASTLLCQNEFNRYYIRALCLRAIGSNLENVQIYRARESSWSRPESEAKIGMSISAKDLLEDLRTSIGIEPKLFPEINSGLSVRI